MNSRLMQYISTQTKHEIAPKHEKKDVRRKYTGENAVNYDQTRQSTEKWQVEQRIIETMLAAYPKRTVILDAPIGTGRFLELYQQKDFVVHGVDVSADMINQAAQKIRMPTAMIDDDRQFAFIQTDLRNISSLNDKSVDVAVNVRITRWLMGEFGAKGIKDMLREMQRLARRRIILTARVQDHPYAVGYDIIKSGLENWEIVEDKPGYQEAYRIIALEPISSIESNA